MAKPSRSIPPILCSIDADGLAEAASLLRAGADALADRESLRSYDFQDGRVQGMTLTSSRNGRDVRVDTGRSLRVSMTLTGSGRSMDIDFDDRIAPYVHDLDALEQGSLRRIRVVTAMLERIPGQSASRLEKARTTLEETARAVAAYAGARGRHEASIVLAAPGPVGPGRCEIHCRPELEAPEVAEWALSRTLPLIDAFVDQAGDIRRYRLRQATTRRSAGGTLDVIRDIMLLPEHLRR